MKRQTTIKWLFILSILGFSGNLMATHPYIHYLRDRKWDARQIYINNLPVDSLTVVGLGLSMVFSTEEDFCYQIVYNDSLGQNAALILRYQVQDIPSTGGTGIKVAKSSSLVDMVYDFNVLYLAENHLVLTFQQPDKQNPSQMNTIEYRFVADNSIYDQEPSNH